MLRRIWIGIQLLKFHQRWVKRIPFFLTRTHSPILTVSYKFAPFAKMGTRAERNVWQPRKGSRGRRRRRPEIARARSAVRNPKFVSRSNERVKKKGAEKVKKIILIFNNWIFTFPIIIIISISLLLLLLLVCLLCAAAIFNIHANIFPLPDRRKIDLTPGATKQENFQKRIFAYVKAMLLLSRGQRQKQAPPETHN